MGERIFFLAPRSARLDEVAESGQYSQQLKLARLWPSNGLSTLGALNAAIHRRSIFAWLRSQRVPDYKNFM